MSLKLIALILCVGVYVCTPYVLHADGEDDLALFVQTLIVSKKNISKEQINELIEKVVVIMQNFSEPTDDYYIQDNDNIDMSNRSDSFGKIEETLNTFLDFLEKIDRENLVAREDKAIITRLVEELREKIELFNLSKAGFIVRSNVQSTALVLNEVIKLLQGATVVVATAADMTKGCEATIQKERRFFLQRTGVVLIGASVCLYLALYACNVSNNCNVPLPAPLDLITKLSSFIS